MTHFKLEIIVLIKLEENEKNEKIRKKRKIPVAKCVNKLADTFLALK